MKTINLFLSLLLSILLFISFCFCQNSKCVFKNPITGRIFNLTKIKELLASNDYYFPKGSGNPPMQWDAWINICQALILPICTPGSSGCQQWDPAQKAGHASLGYQYTMTPFLTPYWRESDFSLNYAFGDAGRSYEVDFKCNSEVELKIQFFKEDPPMHYNFYAESKYICEESKNCENRIGCQNCLQDSGCKYCLGPNPDIKNTCVDAKSTKCTTNYITDKTICSKLGCTSFSTCKDCLSNSNCEWCLGSNYCEKIGSTCGNPITSPQFCDLRK